MYLCDKISYCRFCRRQIGTNCKILNETRLGNKKKVPKYCIFNKTQPNEELRHTHSNSLAVIVFPHLSLSRSLSLFLSLSPSIPNSKEMKGKRISTFQIEMGI